MPVVDFWFELASTYSYPAAMRVEDAARAAGVELAWRPFLLGPIFRAQGWNDSPFNVYPAKGRYMWRDLERVCARHGLALRRPSVFPRNGLHAARIALVGAGRPWGPAFVRAAYRANFVEDHDVASHDVLASLLREVGVAPEPVLAEAASEETKAGLRIETDRAARLGIFGAPSFVVGDELFWGNDRLEEALAFARGRHPLQRERAGQ